jgi:hypothetical protein
VGYVPIAGECRRLGVRVSASSVRNLLRRHRLGPAPWRSGPTWTEFLRAQAAGTLACDFFTVETIGLTRLCVLFFVELDRRQVQLAGITAPPPHPRRARLRRWPRWLTGQPIMRSLTCGARKVDDGRDVRVCARHEPRRHR